MHSFVPDVMTLQHESSCDFKDVIENVRSKEEKTLCEHLIE